MNLSEFKKLVPHPLRQATLVFLVRGDKVLLAMKKRGFGEGRWNGVGGKVEEGEMVREAAIRETQEEIGVSVLDLKEVARLNFYFPHISVEKDWNQEVVVFLATNWEGEPTESEEMRPNWYTLNELPLSEMWSDDELWLPRVLAGEQLYAEFAFGLEQNVEESLVEVIS